MHPYDGRVVSNFILQALHGEDITIYGDGSQTRSFGYVDDTVDGLIRLMNQALRHLYDLAVDLEYDMYMHIYTRNCLARILEGHIYKGTWHILDQNRC